MNPTAMAEKPMFPTLQGSYSSGGEPGAVKVARPVRREGWRRPAGILRPLAAPSLLYEWRIQERRQRAEARRSKSK